MKEKKYNLPDFDIFKKDKDDYFIWVPDKTYVVLGASNNVNEALNIENIKADEIDVLKRPSGGQSVVLSPNNIILSILYIEKEKISPKVIFDKINELIIETLEELGIEKLCQKGISDIAIGEKKILGSSIYRKKEKLFYHAVLNIAENSETFEKYLKHPSKEPEYRQGRKHKDFVTSINECGYNFSCEEIKFKIEEKFNEIYGK